MSHFITGEDRSQSTLFPESFDDYITEDNPVRMVDYFVDNLNLAELDFNRVEPAITGRPAYHPSTILKIYIYGYLNRVQSSRRLERESQRNIELMWLTGRLTPDFKTIADFRKDNGKEIVACEDDNITTYVPKTDTSNSKAEGRFSKEDFQYIAEDDEYRCPADQRLTYRFDTFDKKSQKQLHVYMTSACKDCKIREQCTKGKERRISRWEHEDVLDVMQQRLEERPEKMLMRKQTVEHPYGTFKDWMGATHFQMRTLANVKTEMSLHVLAYNMKRAMKLLGVRTLIEAIQA